MSQGRWGNCPETRNAKWIKKKKKFFSGKNMTKIKTGSLLPQTLIKHHLLQIPRDMRAMHLDNAML